MKIITNIMSARVLDACKIEPDRSRPGHIRIDESTTIDMHDVVMITGPSMKVTTSCSYAPRVLYAGRIETAHAGYIASVTLDDTRTVVLADIISIDTVR